MTVTLMVLAAGVGVGLWALAVWLFPPKPSLAEILAHLEPTAATPAAAPSGVPPEQDGWAVRAGWPFIGLLRATGLPTAALRQDLAALGRSAEAHLAEKATAGLAGALFPSVVGLAFAAGGRPFPWTIPVTLALLLGVGGFMLPDLTVKADADRQRRAFRYALSAYLSLIQVLLAGGAGVESALTDAAAIGDSWPFVALRRALRTARETRVSPWVALGQLGADLQVSELVELADAVALAGTEGARVRQSLEAKATTLRVRQAQDAEADAAAATERMSVPGVLIAVGFILFIFYPALTSISRSF
ncbi:type II secretion system F family protein [Frankia sp. AgB1.9]|uniref:type II secretion system F family protein n=1 Tax=unclassified Frankia TaxID=2632575 RepID=UPI001932E497|nr:MULTISPECIES: type II secretion system F family protein [unclassified Frankia]MBL7487772.1 type II secretion system F family protein [Frankia sp. AgW1.1]MBL7553718.1 type II secretion system F family protein [Frankia sp. AgB1.9]MBL7622932.1 type II secretion system F family protein [Frankia sp. AgB1.8]